MTITAQWDGLNFTVFNINDRIVTFSGIYIFTKIISHVYYAVYIGESQNVPERVINHKVDNKAIFDYAEQVHCLIVNQGDWARKEIEKRLIQKYNPPLNSNYRTGYSVQQIRASGVPDCWTQLQS